MGRIVPVTSLRAGLASISGFGTVAASSGSPTFAPNLPAGMTVLVDRQWSKTDASIPGGVLPPNTLTGTDSTGMQWYQGGNVKPLIDTPANLSTAIGVTVPPLPDGYATAMAIKYTSGFPAGDLPFGCFRNAGANHRRLYHAAWFLMPANFDPNSNNLKWLFFAQGGSRNHVLMLSSGGLGGRIGPWLALQGGGNGSVNVGGAANTQPGAVYRLSSVSNANGCWDFRTNQWCCIEWLVTMESATGASDGQFQSWFNGTLTNDFRNLHYSTSGDPTVFDGVSIEPYYGGGGGAAPAVEYYCVGRFFVAGS